MISKRLLALYIHTLESIHMVDEIGSTIHWQGTSIEGNIVTGSINEFKVASGLKEIMLCYGNGYCISSFIEFDHETWFANVSGSVFKKGFQGATEPEAIYKACEWIIETEDKLENPEHGNVLHVR